MEKAEVLFLCHRIPYPPDKGDKIRSWRMLRHLASKYHVHLGCFVDDPHDMQYRDKVSEIVKSAAFVELSPLQARIKSLSAFLRNGALSDAYYASSQMRRYVENVRGRSLSVEIIFSAPMAQYISTPRGSHRRIVDFCDADSEKWRAYGADMVPPMSWVYRYEADRARRTEQDIIGWADHCFAITPDEASLFAPMPGEPTRVDWWCNGVDTEYFDPALVTRAPAEPVDVIFTGAMDYKPNVDAVLRFAAGPWQQIMKAIPEARFGVVGARPVASIKALGGNGNIVVTGRVDDMRDWLKAAKVAIAPMDVARGVQNKVLEAMAMGLPVVASTPAITGIECADSVCVEIADDPKSFAASVIALLGDPQRRLELGAMARERVVHRHNWASQLKRFDNSLP